MTNEQKKLIDSIIAEFNKISKQTSEKKAFNLIDLESHKMDEIRIKKEWTRELNLRMEEWGAKAREECNRIAELLRTDLPTLNVKVRNDGQAIRIFTETRNAEINVFIKTEKFQDPIGNTWLFPCGFSYTANSKYDTIEEAVKDKYFMDKIYAMLAE
jgi:hypothetical protein